jgi:Zn finger protein HypA/HybF involved in hydrogenase expression
MILDKFVEVKINPSNYKRLRELNYIFDKVGEIIKIKIEDISTCSKIKVNVKCVNCENINKIEYANYKTQIKKGDCKYYCYKCKSEKIKKTNLEKYNVDNISKLDTVKQLKINTTYKNYGVNYTFQSEINKNKRIDTLFNKYGVYHNSQLDSYKEKRLKDTFEYNLEYRKYRNHVRRITRLNKKVLFENWNGYDYYDNEYIKDNLNKFNSKNRLYPSIDHKNSIIYGFINNISPEILGSLDNLCITKRCINSSKNKKIEIDFICK